MTLDAMLSRVGLLSFLAGIALASPAAAFCRLTTKSPSSSEGGAMTGCVEDGIELAWQRRCISYTLVPSAELDIGLEDLRAVVDRSFATWTQVRCGAEPLPVVLGQTEQLGECSFAEYNRFGPNANTVAFASDWMSRGKDFLPEAYGLTLVWHNPSTGEILDADIQINLSHSAPVVLCGSAKCDAANIDLQNVLTHEVGHFLGLAHSPDRDATMYGDADVAEILKRDLGSDDEDGVCAIYGGEPALTCAPEDYAPRRGFSEKCARPKASSTCAAQPGRASRSALGAAGLVTLGLGLLARLARRRSIGAD